MKTRFEIPEGRAEISHTMFWDLAPWMQAELRTSFLKCALRCAETWPLWPAVCPQDSKTYTMIPGFEVFADMSIEEQLFIFLDSWQRSLVLLQVHSDAEAVASETDPAELGRFMRACGKVIGTVQIVDSLTGEDVVPRSHEALRRLGLFKAFDEMKPGRRYFFFLCTFGACKRFWLYQNELAGVKP